MFDLWKILKGVFKALVKVISIQILCWKIIKYYFNFLKLKKYIKIVINII